MGKLDYLEVENFKSYKGIQKIGPFFDFTAVIGPNGSGKSNLMDALSFVLGIKSKQLRSGSMKELIYRGPPHLKDKENQPTSASVTMVYKQSDDQQLVLKRKITSSGTSDYYVDGKKTSYTNYDSKLAEENILVEARNFLVFQGDVESVASQSGRQLTNLVEQISGSLQYKEEYDRLKVLLDRKVEASNFNLDKKKGMNMEVEQFEVELQEAENFTRLRQELEGLNLKLILLKLFDIERKFVEVENMLDDEDRKVVQVTQQLEVDNEKLRKAKVALSRSQLDLKKTEQQIRELELVLENNQPDLVTAQTQLNHATTKLQSLQNNKSKVQAEATSQQDKVEQLTHQLQAANQALQQHEVAAQAQKAQDLSAKDLKEYQSIKSNFLKATAQLTQQLEILERPEQLLQDQIKELEVGISQLQHRTDRLTQSKIEHQSRLEHLQNEAQTLQKNQAEAQNSLDQLLRSKTELEHQEMETNEKLTLTLNQLLQIQVDHTTTQRELKLQEGIDTLQRVYPQVYGKLSQSIQAKQKKFETAILTILGSNLEAILVQELPTAVQCVNYLKEHRLGSCKFLPLDSLTPPKPKESLRDLPNVRMVSDLIQVEAKFDNAILYACNNAIVVDTYKQAQRLAQDGKLEVRIVTLDGTVFYPNGTIEGGPAKPTAVQKTVKKWNEQQVHQLKRQKEQLLKRMNEISKEKTKFNINVLEGLKSKVKGIQSSLEVNLELKSKTERDIHSKTQELEMLTKSIQDKDHKKEELQKEIEAKQVDSNKVRDQINQQQDSFFQAFCRRLKLTDIRTYEQHHFQTTKAQLQQQNQFKSLVSKCENQLEFESQRYQATLKRVQQLEKNLQKQTDEFNKLEQGLNKIKQKQEKDLKKKADLENVLQDKVEAREKASQEVEKMNRGREEQAQELDWVKRNIATNETTLAQLDSQRTSLLRAALLEQIPIPLILGSLQQFDDLQVNPIDPNATHREHRYLGVDQRIQSSHWHTQVDFGSLSESDKQNLHSVVPQLESEKEDLKKQVERLHPNLKVLDKKDLVNERRDKIDEEFDQARNQAIEVKDQFLEVKAKRYEAFYTAFTQIAQSIDQIYKSLTRSSSAPAGGTAYLSLQNSEEPYLADIYFHATPPLKRFRDMDSLSGGEKSVAALALLLAMQEVRKAPFLVLDEVDAALDNSNVRRVGQFFTRWVQQKGTQVIVISLKQQLFERAQALVGVSRDLKGNCSSVLTLDLTKYVE